MKESVSLSVYLREGVHEIIASYTHTHISYLAIACSEHFHGNKKIPAL